MKNVSALFILLWSLSVQVSVTEAQETKYNTPGAGNPILPGYFADPTVRKFNGVYYIYATTDGTAGGLGPSQVWKSKDFVNWFAEPMNWPKTRQIWAPDVMKASDGKYYMYYCQACKVYCAVADVPTGPWKNIFGAENTVLIPDGYVKNAITLDAQSFVDDDGSTYLYWGTWGIYPKHGCAVGKLTPDKKSFSDTLLIPNTDAKYFFEAPYVFKRKGVYYLMYSSDHCEDASYKVQYATSRSGPMGPFQFAGDNPVLSTNSDGTIHGPGHNSILKEGENYYIVYHRHNIPHSTRGFNRQIAVNRLEFDKEDRIKKIQADHKGIGYLQKNSNPYKNIAFGKKIVASSYYNDDFKPEYANDDNNATLWKAKNSYDDARIEIDLGKRLPVKRIWTQFEYATSFYQYLYETSEDGKKWEIFSDRRKNTLAGSPMIEHGNAKARYVRLTVTGNEKNGLFPAVWNIKIFSQGKDPFPENDKKFNGQDSVAAEKPHGLLFRIDADDYPSGSLLGRIQNETNKAQGFDATGMAVKVENYQGKSAFSFKGYQQFLSDFALPATIKGNSPYAIIAWINSPDPKENECILDVNQAYEELSKIILGYGKSKSSGITMHYGGFEDTGLDSIRRDDEEWKQIAVSFDGYIEKIYIDGRLIKEKNIFLNVNPCNQLTLGCKFDGEFPFRNRLHSLEMYDKALSGKDILNDYKKETTMTTTKNE